MMRRPRVVTRKYGRYIAGFVLAAVVSCALFVATSRFFEIQRVEIVGEQVNVMIDESRFNKHLLFFHSEELQKQLLFENPLLASVSIHKKFPHTLVIVTATRVPFARVATGSVALLVDKDGVVLPNDGAGTNLSTLRFDVPTEPTGTTLRDPFVQRALETLRMMSNFLPITLITKLDGAAIRVVSDKTSIYIPQTGDLMGKAYTLQTLTAGFRIKGTMPAIIDLRFDKPVITL